jgi:ketosteroid isomerase-like protein/cytoskeletal protein RodZ
MSQDNSEFPYQIPFLYRLRSKIQVYLANRSVKSSFQRKSFSKPLALFVGAFIILTLASIVWGVWFFQNYRINITRIDAVKPSVVKSAATEPVISEKKEVAPAEAKGEEKISEAIPALPMEESKKESETELEKEPLPQPMETPMPATEQEEKKTEAVSIPATVPQKEEKKEEYMKTRADLVNVRKNSFLESEIIARLDADYVVKVLNRDGDWVEVDTENDLTGWIYIDLLEAADQEEYLAWTHNPNRIAAKQIIRRDLDDPKRLESERVKIKEILESWKGAWEAKDIDGYMNFYSLAFVNSEHTWESYKTYKGFIFKKPGAISIKILDLSVKWSNSTLVASFIQKYQSDTVNSTRRKVMHFQQEGQDWKILKEVVIVE